MSKTLLQTQGLCAFYGATQILFDIDVKIHTGAMTALFGANGAGKTTLLRALSGMVRTKGGIFYDGNNIATLETEKRAQRGIAHVPQGRGTFLHQTVADNLRIGAMTRRNAAGISGDLEQTYMWFPKLRDRRSQRAGTLSGGEQQMLSIGRALMLRPKLLLLDEPSFGLAPKIVEDIFEILNCLKQRQGLGLLIGEQNASLCLDLADNAYILRDGSIAMRGTAADLHHSDHIRSLYFGHTVA